MFTLCYTIQLGYECDLKIRVKVLEPMTTDDD